MISSFALGYAKSHAHDTNDADPLRCGTVSRPPVVARSPDRATGPHRVVARSPDRATGPTAGLRPLWHGLPTVPPGPTAGLPKRRRPPVAPVLRSGDRSTTG